MHHTRVLFNVLTKKGVFMTSESISTRYCTVFWDFNGTVMDDVALGIKCVNKMLAKRNLPIIQDRDSYQKLFCFPVEKYYGRLGFDFTAEPYEGLAVEWVDLFTSNESSLTLNPGFLETSAFLSENGIRQIILSSSETVMLHRQIRMLGIDKCFDAVYGTDNIYAGGKIEMAKRCLGTKLDHAVLIGDTLHDYETACAIGIDCILFSGGHGSMEDLSVCGCPVVRSLNDTIPILKNMFIKSLPF